MKAAILGFGTVGSGVWKVLTENQEQVKRYLGAPVEIAHVLDLRTFEGHPVQQVLTQNIEDIITDPEVEVVVECMGGLHPAYEFVHQALTEGKAVVTSNKALVAAYGADLMKTACDHQTDFFFEASVCGGIPVLRTIRHSLAQEQILAVEGIFNGTTNFILSRMEQGLTYEAALAEAQAKGYAEADPTADVEGIDACRKLAIIASMLCGHAVLYEDIPTEGITKVTSEEVQQMRAVGKRIRLIARVTMENGTPVMKVGPEAIDAGHPLAQVKDVYNAVLIRGNMVGDIMLQGQGAGSEATASAIVSDVLNALNDRRRGIFEPACWTE